ncbi:TVP38/TMEM64 family protein [Methyloprofundus sp.]|uniref:TVP38/TMEM64 family protein n=1 Tax=Methyloprofundus sp. TaxID=2020875 RepID=UPI003D0B432F
MISFHNHSYSTRRIFTSLVVIISVIFIGYWLESHITLIEAGLKELGPWASIGFIALFILLTPFFFSVDVLCVIAGALFSLSEAIVYVMIATMLASAVIFYLGRFAAREKAQMLLQQHPKLEAFSQLVDDNGFKVMFLLRLLPIPFALLSYIFAISKTRFLPYWIATSGLFIYNTALVYFGYLAAHFSDQLTQGDNYEGPQNILLFGGIFASVLVILLISKIAKHQLAQMHPDAEIAL